MSEKTFEEMTYGELKAACKEKGLKATGNKEALLTALQAEPDADTPEVTKKPESKVTDQQVKKELKNDAAAMKAHLSKQKKVDILIPLEAGVPPETAEKIPFVVNMNGYRLSIKRGTFVSVPEQVAEMVKERLQSEGLVGRDLRIDRDEKTLDALG